MMRVILSLVFCAALASQAMAQAAPSPIDHWDSGLLVDILHALGSTDVEVSAADGHPIITAITREGLKATLVAKGCDPSTADGGSTCHAVEVIFTFPLSTSSDRVATADQLNHGFALGKYTLEADGMLRDTRYLLLDGGVSQDNLRAELIDTFTVASLTRDRLTVDKAPR